MEAIPLILLVDDDQTTRQITRWLLNELCVPGGVQILEAAHGAHGLKLVQTHGAAAGGASPMLVLLDLHMPVMGGLEFMERLRHLPASCRQATKVVAISATVNPTEHETAISLADAFRRKPLTMPGLSELLRHYLPSVLAAGQQ